MRTVFAAFLAMATATAPAMAKETSLKDGNIVTETYSCERGVEVPVTYINVGDESLAVLSVDGKQITMQIAVSGSGSRYVSIDEQDSYRWQSDGQEALLFHLEADDTAQETTVLSQCQKNAE